MVMYRYRAIGPAGDLQTGTMDAATEAEVIAQLQKQGRIPLRAELAQRGSWVDALRGSLAGSTGSGLRRSEVGTIMREMATMLAAGQDLDRALRYLHETAPNARVRGVVAGLRDGVRDGSSLSVALAGIPERSPACTWRWCARARRAGSLPPRWNGWPNCWSVSRAWPHPSPPR